MRKIVYALLFSVLLLSPAYAVELVAPDGLSGSNLSVLVDDDYVIDGAVIGGTVIPYDDTPMMFSAKNASRVEVSITPSGSGLAGMSMNLGTDMEEFPLPISIYGTVATVTGASPKEYTITITAYNTAGQSDRKTYTFKIYPEPAINASTPEAVTWGEEYSFKPSASSVSVWEIASDGLEDSPEYLTELPDGLDLNADTGEIYGTWKAGDDEDGLAFGTDKTELTRKIRLTAWQEKGEKYAQRDYTLKFAAVPPAITNDADTLTKDYFSTLMYDEECEAVITAEGPGVISWTVDNLPKGLEIISEDSDGISYLTITGTPLLLMKAQAVTITAENSAGTMSVSPKFTVGYDGKPEFTDDTIDTAPNGVYAVGMSIADEPIDYDFGDDMRAPYKKPANVKSYEDHYGIIEAFPGPFTWKAKGLPDGITLSYDYSDGSLVELVGTFKKAGTSKYTLTATNTVTKKSISLSNSFTVYATPEITTKSLPVLTTEKKYSAKLAASNSPAYWYISFASGTDPDENDYTDETYDVDGDSETELEWDSKKLTITGILTARPSSGKFTVRVQAENPAGTGEKIFVVDVNGKAPAFTTKSLAEFVESGTADIETTGTTPIKLGAYIDASTAKNVFGLDGTKAIDLTEEDNITGLFFEGDEDSGTGTLDLVSGVSVAYKNLPVTFSAENSATTKKPVTKKMALSVEGEAPAIYMLDENDQETETPASMTITAGNSALSYTFRITGDDPVSVTSTLPFGTSNAAGGIYNIYKETEDGYRELTLFIDPMTVAKEAKTAITITAMNPSTKAKAVKKLTVIRQTGPVITTNAKGLIKEVEAGKALSLKLAVKGSSPITWTATDTDGEDASEILEEYGLAFNDSTGAFTGKASEPTFDDDGYYSPKKFIVTASNTAGTSSPVTVTIGIKGKKPKITTKTLTFSRTEPDFASARLTTDISASDKTANVKYSTTDSKLSDIGLAIVSSSGNEGTLDKSGTLKATKGTSVKIAADNYGGIATGNVKFIINDPAPVISTATIETIQAEEKIAAAKTVTLKLAEAPTGDTKLKWAVSAKPYKGITATLKPNASGSEATLTLTAAKKFTGSGNITDTSVGITVTNTNTKASGTASFPFSVKAYNAVDDVALPPDSTEAPEGEIYAEEIAEDTADIPTEHGTLALGTARTVAGLSVSEQAYIRDNGYTVAAVLPELSADISGQYDIDVELSDSVPSGAEMFWVAFPRNAEPSEDDDIADFYDDTGEYTRTVPESHNITVSPWLRENVIYAPVIMVK